MTIQIQKQKQKEPSPELKQSLDKLADVVAKSPGAQKLKEKREAREFPPFETQKITRSWQYRKDKYGNRDGPYLYLYWRDKQTHKLKRYYVGKNIDDHDSKQNYELLGLAFGHTHWRFKDWKKWEFLWDLIIKEKNKLAEVYLKRVDDGEVTIDWAYRLVKKSIHEIKTNTLLAMATTKENITHNTVDGRYGNPATDNKVITHFLYQKGIFRDKQIDEYLESDEVKQEYVAQTWTLWNKYTHTIKVEEKLHKVELCGTPTAPEEEAA
jgi:hypothetical protein